MRAYCGRVTSPDDIETIRSLISQDPNLTRAALSRQLCVLWQWLKPHGELKARQEVHQQQAAYSTQGYLALSTAQELRSNLASVEGWVGRMFATG